MTTSLLIVDDEPKMSSVLARMLARDGYAVDWSDNPRDAMSLLEKRPYDIILCDLRMPGFSGIDVLDHAKNLNPAVDFVMMTAYATPQTAVESMKKGAIDYLIKPFSIDDLRTLIRRIETTRTAPDNEAEVAPAPQASSPSEPPVSRPIETPSFPTGTSPSRESLPSSAAPAAQHISEKLSEIPGLIAESPQMQTVLARIRKVAASEASVLLRGESGTGKEVIARTLHQLSRRAAAPLITVNCGAIPESLMESELFGHIKGSFTGAIENRKGLFESADSGTIFLDEIGEVPPYLQVKLLRVLQEGEIQRVGESQQRKVDVRVIAATNRDLENDIAAGEFRQDLYYRLNVIPVVLPPLRQRRSDIGPLVQHFLHRFAAPGQQPPRVSPAAMQLLLEYDYPGNIRELENAIEHAVVLCDDNEIASADLPLQIQSPATAAASASAGSGNSEIESATAADRPTSHLEQAEISLIIQALEKTNYNFTRAAQHLGITRRTLGYRIQKYGLHEEIAKQKGRAD